MIRIVWITGRAATGKSTVIQALRAELHRRGIAPYERCDEELLMRLVRADRDHVHHFHPDGDDTIAFRTGHLFDEGLRILSADLVAFLAEPAGLAVVEMARGTWAGPVDITYRRALDLIDPHVWRHSMVFRLDVPPSVQRARNRSRATACQRSTPEPVMQALYGRDDPESFVRAGVPIREVAGDDVPNAVDNILKAARIDDTTYGASARRTPLDGVPR